MSFPSRHLAKQKRRPRPEGYSDLSNTPYYKKKDGEELLPILQQLIENPNKKIELDCYKFGCAIGTLYCRVEQAWKWLSEKHEEAEKWAKLRGLYHVTKDYPFVRIVKKIKNTVGLSEGAAIIDDEAREYSAVANWRRTITDYIDESKDGDKPLEMRGLRLSERDIDSLSIMFGNLDEKIAVIYLEPSRLKIVKNAELAKKLKETRGGGKSES